MTKASKTIVFFGSGPVAADSLRLLAQDFEIEAVVTKPRPPHHKGDVPVLTLAKELGLQTLFAADKAGLDTLFASRPVKSELAVLIDFGILVSQDIIDYFPLGIINSHFSILPEWRGADPITFSILSGQAQTGVSLMLVVEALDEGPLLAYGEYDLLATITTPELTDDLISLSHSLLTDIVPKYIGGEIEPTPQSVTGREVSYSRKLTKQDGVLDWQKPAAELEREVRAYQGWPRSRNTVGHTPVIVTAAHVVAGSGTPGSLWQDGKQFGFYTAKDILVIDTLIPAGKPAMPAAAFLAGYQL